MLLWLLYAAGVLIVIIVLVFVFAALFGRGEDLPPLPETPKIIAHNRAMIDAGDVDSLRFETCLRGYSPDQVDDVIAYLLKKQDANRLDLEETK